MKGEVILNLERSHFSDFNDFLAGLCTIEYSYSFPYPEDLDEEHRLFYENSLSAEMAIYVLDITSGKNSDIVIGAEKRNELLQDQVLISFGQESVFAESIDYSSVNKQKPSEQKRFDDSSRLIGQD